jgi:NO-binding membrane sensor protein with MHYT domain
MAHHFEMGVWLLFLAYATSVVGATIGLACTMQVRTATTPATRLSWLVLAALSIGGVSIWLMHFLGMLGFSTPGMPVRTLLSAGLSVGAVFAGLVIFGVQKAFAPWRLAVAGVVTGLAISLMHYTGMWAVNVRGTISYNPGLVLLSIAIGIAAATASLWFTVAVNTLPMRLLAGAVMGVASTGMHYTGMSAVRVDLDAAAPDPAGVEVFSFLFPVFVLAAAALALPIVALLTTTPTDDDEVHPIAVTVTR